MSVLNYGDISCVSTHATQIFNTGKGGGLICADPTIEKRAKRLRFFGYDDNKLVVDKGINGKMTEIHAALGLTNLNHFSKTVKHRSRLAKLYTQNLLNTSGIRLQTTHEGSNHAYFPIIFDNVEKLQDCMHELEKEFIYPRRYFSPSLEQIKCIEVNPHKSNIVHSAYIAERIICLPIHDLVEEKDVFNISTKINHVLAR